MVLIFEERVASNPNIFFHLQKIWYWAINNPISAFPIGSQVHVFVPEKWLRENIMNTSYFTCTLPTKLLAMIPRPPASGCVDQVFWVIRNHGTVKTVALWKSHLDNLLFQPKAHLINTWGQNLSFVPNLLTFWSTCHLLRDLSFLWTNFLMWLCIIGRTSKCLIYYQIFWNLIPSKKPAVQTNIGKPRIFNKYFSTRFVWWKTTMLHQRSQDALTLIRTTNPNLLKDMKLIKLGLSGWKLLVFKTQSVEHFFLHFWFVCADGNVRF